MILLDRFSNGLILALFCLENQILVVFACQRLVRRHLHHIQAVHLLELFRFSKGRTGHATQLFIQAEEILERNSRECAAFLQNRHTFFGLNRLVQPFAIAAALHQTAGVFVHDDYFAVICYNIIFIALKHHLCLQCLLDVIHRTHVVWGV